MITVQTARPEDIWPPTHGGGCPHPDETRDEIMRTARSIPLPDIEKMAVQTGLTPWFCAFRIAEQKVLAVDYQPPPVKQEESEIDQLRRRVEQLERALAEERAEYKRNVKAINHNFTSIHDVLFGKENSPGQPGLLDACFERVRALEAQQAVAKFDLVPEYDGERTLTLRWLDGSGVKHSVEWKLPIIIDRGVYSAGKSYEQGDLVSWGGSMWIAQTATSERPGEGSTNWRLAVKKGKDGKDGRSPHHAT